MEPKSIEPALRNSSALLEPADCTQTMATPSLANSFSNSPFCFRIIEHRIVGRPVQANFLERVGREGCAGTQQRSRDHAGESAAKSVKSLDVEVSKKSPSFYFN